jgi:serine/threonine protein kinase
MGACLTRELVERYTAGGCLAEEKLVIETHIAECDSCRQQIESSMSNTGQTSKPNSADDTKPAAKAPVDKTVVLNDDFSTRAIPPEEIAEADKPDFAKSLESMIGGYEIVEEMPRGGQAAVYMAVHTATKTNVAIKVLLPTLLASARARYYFEREAELIASLNHPNIVSIRDSGIIHQQYYFVMQFIEGQPLERYVHSEKLSFRETVMLFNKVCAAISYAHQQGVIHRDLKFANILVDQRGEPHILDFGLAKAVGLSEETPDRAVATMTGQLAGTLSTMSPEQAAGRPDLIDVRTDVYSLGIMLYHMLTGQYPYEVAGSTLQVLQNIQNTEPLRPRHIIHKFDSDVEAILLTALEKDPAKRYQSVAELKSDIENWLDGRPIRVKSISTAYLLRKIIARHRYTSTVAALLLLIIISFGYVSFFLYISTKKAQRETENYARQLTAEIAKSHALERGSVFKFFLEAWRQNDVSRAGFVFGYMSAGSKEKKAAGFLADSSPVADKESDFRRSVPDEDNWFAEFIIGESYLKNGNRNEALEAFNRSHEAAGKSLKIDKSTADGWILEQLEKRLQELSSDDKPAGENEGPKTEN